MGRKLIENPSYSALHGWLVRHFGKAKRCVKCRETGRSRYEWALKKGLEYRRLKSHFLELCVPCHRKYDFTEETRAKQSLAKKGKPSNATGKHWKCKTKNIK